MVIISFVSLLLLLSFNEKTIQVLYNKIMSTCTYEGLKLNTNTINRRLKCHNGAVINVFSDADKNNFILSVSFRMWKYCCRY